MNTALELRRRFLRESALSLFLLTPSTSRQLIRESQLLGPADSASPLGKTIPTCAACGSIIVPQWTVNSKLLTKNPKNAKVAKGRLIQRQKIRSQQCSICHRITKEIILIESSHTRDATPAAAPLQQQSEESTRAPAMLDKAARSSGKKRAKVRKDREGLQALLNKSVQMKSPPSLSLMDLIQR